MCLYIEDLDPENHKGLEGHAAHTVYGPEIFWEENGLSLIQHDFCQASVTRV